jgi:hypothetical protein
MKFILSNPVSTRNYNDRLNFNPFHNNTSLLGNNYLAPSFGSRPSAGPELNNGLILPDYSVNLKKDTTDFSKLMNNVQKPINNNKPRIVSASTSKVPAPTSTLMPIDRVSLLDFKQNVRDYSILDIKQRKLEHALEPYTQKIKKYKNKKKELKQKIVYFMNVNQFDICNLPKELTKTEDTKGAFKCSTTSRVKPLNNDILKKNIATFFMKNKDFLENNQIDLNEKINKLTQFIIENKERSIVKTLRPVKTANINNQLDDLKRKK